MTHLKQTVAELEQRLQASLAERDELLQQRAATNEVLQVINASSGDLVPVFDAILERAMRLCDAKFGLLATYDGRQIRTVAARGVPPAFAEFRKNNPPDYGPGTGPARILAGERVVHIADLKSGDAYRAGDPNRRAVVDLGGARTVLLVALMKNESILGYITIYRKEVRTYSDKQIVLLQNFADQAVIAIENARLFNETKEALEQQTATAGVLQVISSSVSDAAPVFDKILDSCQRLFGVDELAIYLARDDGQLHIGALRGTAIQAMSASLPKPIEQTVTGRILRERQALHIPDAAEMAEMPATARDLLDLRGNFSALFAPMLGEKNSVGSIMLARFPPRPFTDREVALLRTFADQAVIAIENARLFNETKEALERQTATAEILKVIASSPTDVQPVFEAIATSSNRLIGGVSTAVMRFAGDALHLAAFTPTSAEADEALQAAFPRPLAEFPAFQLVRDGTTVQFADTESEDVPQVNRELARLRGFRSMLFTPLMSDGSAIGMISVTRAEPGSFPAHHVQLMQTFADQAVIAIENVRLFDEVQIKSRDLSEALTYQTASSNILGVIASSPTEVDPALQAIGESACKLCDAYDATFLLKIGNDLHFRAHHGPIPTGQSALPINREWVVGRSVVDKVPMQVSDFWSPEAAEFPEGQRQSREQGHRCTLSVPLLRESEALGAIALRRLEPVAFSDKHIALLQTFADQAVIAISNVGLFQEVQARTRDLSESLQQQTATAEVLKVISRSAFHLQPVLDTLVASAVMLCGAVNGTICLREGNGYRHAASSGIDGDWAKFLEEHPPTPGRTSLTGRVILSGRVESVPDVLEDPDYVMPLLAMNKTRSALGVPLLRDDRVEGVLLLARREPGLFAQRQIELVQTFADQAVIAIENVRLFDEVQARTEDLRESLQQQTATAEVLKVISRSAFDLETVLTTLTESAKALCGSASGIIYRREGDVYRYAASTMDVAQGYRDYEQQTDIAAGRGTLIGRMALEKRVVQITDAWNDPEYAEKNAARLGSVRAMLGVPLMRGGEPVGAFALARREPIPFTAREVELVTTFADQAVIAIENARLLEEVQSRTKELSLSLEGLRAAQDRLVQTEKLASLGQLTAGIAHEIKNPLNFINNFSALSAELVDELDETLGPAPLDQRMRGDVGELTQMLKSNLEKVVQHGKRADSIVKNMLLHSREGSGEHRSVDINALVEESLNLAYHGARAEKPGFNITLTRDLDSEAGAVELYPQEISRALLNLISNGFYAATKRKSEGGADTYEPTLIAATKRMGEAVEIRIRDNGTGIPPEVKEKMFNPFFTTKPAGEGTGLGLSMTYDIIVKQHGGSIDVESVPGAFTEFTIVLPRTSSKKRGEA